MVLTLKEMDSQFLARHIYREQMRNGRHGLPKEVTKFCRKVGLPNATLVDVNGKQVDIAIREHNRLVIRSDMISIYKNLYELVEEENVSFKD